MSFYAAQLISDKNSPLHAIWLASWSEKYLQTSHGSVRAHGGGRGKRTDLVLGPKELAIAVDAAQKILRSHDPKALRDTAQLLLGVARVYGRQCALLLHDCESARRILITVDSAVPHSPRESGGGGPTTPGKSPRGQRTLRLTQQADARDIDLNEMDGGLGPGFDGLEGFEAFDLPALITNPSGTTDGLRSLLGDMRGVAVAVPTISGDNSAAINGDEVFEEVDWELGQELGLVESLAPSTPGASGNPEPFSQQVSDVIEVSNKTRARAEAAAKARAEQEEAEALGLRAALAAKKRRLSAAAGGAAVEEADEQEQGLGDDVRVADEAGPSTSAAADKHFDVAADDDQADAPDDTIMYDAANPPPAAAVTGKEGQLQPTTPEKGASLTGRRPGLRSASDATIRAEAAAGAAGNGMDVTPSAPDRGARHAAARRPDTPAAVSKRSRVQLDADAHGNSATTVTGNIMRSWLADRSDIISLRRRLHAGASAIDGRSAWAGYKGAASLPPPAPSAARLRRSAATAAATSQMGHDFAALLKRPAALLLGDVSGQVADLYRATMDPAEAHNTCPNLFPAAHAATGSSDDSRAASEGGGDATAPPLQQMLREERAQRRRAAEAAAAAATDAAAAVAAAGAPADIALEAAQGAAAAAFDAVVGDPDLVGDEMEAEVEEEVAAHLHNFGYAPVQDDIDLNRVQSGASSGRLPRLGPDSTAQGLQGTQEIEGSSVAETPYALSEVLSGRTQEAVHTLTRRFGALRRKQNAATAINHNGNGKASRGDADDTASPTDATAVNGAVMSTDDQPPRLQLNDVLEGSGRLAAARWFFESLVLHSKNFVVAEQQEPYGEVVLTPGPRMPQLVQTAA